MPGEEIITIVNNSGKIISTVRIPQSVYRAVRPLTPDLCHPPCLTCPNWTSLY